MASYKILTVQGNRQKTQESNATVLDLLSVKIGASGLEIKETSGHFDISAKKIVNAADGLAATDLATKGQMDTALALYIPLAQKAANNGVASLDGGGKVPVSQLPNAIMTYEGMFDASDTPASPLLNGDIAANAGMVYKASVAGSYDFGAGAIAFTVGDYAIYNSSGVWEKSDSTDAIISVNAQTGVVVLTKTDIGLSNVDNVQQLPMSYLDTDVTLAADSDLKVPSQKAIKAYVDGQVGGSGDFLDTVFRVSDNGDASKKIAFQAASITTATTRTITMPDANVDLGNLTNSNIAAGAGIVDTKLATISTANKVSGSAVQLASGNTLKDNTGLAVDHAKSFINDNGGTITVRQVVYVKADGDIDLAQATTANLHDFALGLVEDATILTTASGKITVRRGAIVPGFTGLTPGQKLYVSRTTAGDYVQDLTGFVSGEHVYSLGRAMSATELLFDPQYEFEF